MSKVLERPVVSSDKEQNNSYTEINTEVYGLYSGADYLLNGLTYELDDDDFLSATDIIKNEKQFASEHNATIEGHKALKKKGRRLSIRNFFSSLMIMSLIVAVAAFVMILLGPQQELSEIAKDNSDLKDEISVLRRQIVDSEESVNGITDMDSIRAQALALGMQDPSVNQVVNVATASGDRLVSVVTYDAYGVSEEAYNNALSSLSRYYIENPSE